MVDSWLQLWVSQSCFNPAWYGYSAILETPNHRATSTLRVDFVCVCIFNPTPQLKAGDHVESQWELEW